MNDAIRGAVNARLHEKHMTRAELSRLTGLRPQAVTRALNGAEGGGTVPTAWAAIFDALGLALVAVPLEAAGQPLDLPSVPPADLGARVDEALKLLTGIKAGLGEAVGSSTNGTAPAGPEADEPGSAGGGT